VEIKLHMKPGRYKTFPSNQVEIKLHIKSGGDETIEPSKINLVR